MTVKAPEQISIDPWDYFLDDLASEHVERFREQEWPIMLKELIHEQNYKLGEGQEPHWSAPGKVIFYHEVINTSYGKSTNHGWQTTNPLPVGNAIQLLNYLKKGFRLRANVDPLVNVELFEADDLTEGDTYENTPYVVPSKKGDRKFINWNAYRNYCINRGIALSIDPPEDILDKMQQFEYYCLLHDRGFHGERATKQHRAYYIGPFPLGRGRTHATIEQMKVVIPDPIQDKKITTKTK
jgi:hypothetical protein